MSKRDRLFGLSENDNGTVGAFYVKSVPYRDKRGRKKVKQTVMVQIHTPRVVRRPVVQLEHQIDRPATEADKQRFPKAWARCQAIMKEAEE